MEIAFVRFLSSKEKWLEVFEAEYTRKIKGLFPFKYHCLKSKVAPRSQWEDKVREEYKRLSNFLESGDRLILFDEKGQRFKDSLEFSRFLIQNIESSPRRLVFAVGGPYGFSKDAQSLAHHKVCLCQLTMSHQVAIVCSMEQIYRGLSIWKGLPYHNKGIRSIKYIFS